MHEKIIKSYKFKPSVLAITTGLGITLFILSTCFVIDIFRARVIDIDKTTKLLAKKKQKENNYFGISKVVFQKGSIDKGFDFRCLSWSSKLLYSGWGENRVDHDFFIDYYIPPGKKAIICATPALSAALAAHPRKRFLYEVSKIDLDDGLYVRVVIGLSEVRQSCKSITGSVDCMNFILSRQAGVKFEP